MTPLLAGDFGVDADDDRLGDRGMGVDDGLDLDRVDLEAAGLDQQLLAALDVEQPVLVEPAEVAGEEAAVAEGDRVELRQVAVAGGRRPGCATVTSPISPAGTGVAVVVDDLDARRP